MIKNITWITAFVIILNVSSGFAQKNTTDSITHRFTTYRNNNLQEKIYAHLDRNFYVAGENIWFKLYYVDGHLHRPLDVSKVAYLEILDSDNKAVLQTKISLLDGTGSGQLFLPVSLSTGNYIVRVYTSWMKNYSPDLYSQQPITIVNTVRKAETVQKIIAPEFDVQFFPEGGHLVDDIKSTVGFRIVDKSGKGKDISGAILNQRGETVASFKSLKFGLGRFTMRPSVAEQYKVVLNGEANNAIKFPVVQSQGYQLSVRDTINNQLNITVRSKGVEASTVFMFVHTRQVIRKVQAKVLGYQNAVFLLDKNLLGEGISHITIFNENLQPVCERLYFKAPPESLTVQAQSDKQEYASRKKIQVDLNVATNTFKTGSFSISVFKDDSLAQFDPLDIQSYEFLTSDLKGHIESPAFYFSNDPTASLAADNLMLTHGWSRFKWDDIFSKAKPVQFNPEYRGHVISGTITDSRTGAPAPGIQTFLSTPTKNVRLYTSLSDAQGRVQFEVKDFYDSKKIMIQPNLNRDSTYQMAISSPYSENYHSFSLPTLNYTPAWRNPLTARSLSMQIENTYQGIKSIIAVPPTIDSAAFYGQADEKYLLDDYTRFTVMEEVMREYVHGVWVRKRGGKFIFKVPDEPHHSIFPNESMVMLDGVPIFNIEKIMSFNPLKVQKLDVMTRKYFLGPFAFEGIVSYITYKGDLGGFELDPRVTVLNYQGLQLQKEFFSPKYETATQIGSRMADRRNLLYWAPNITLTGQEKKSIEFYSSDEPGIYKIVIQGMSVDGRVGSAATSFEVKGPENN